LLGEVQFLDSKQIVGRQLHALDFLPIPHTHWWGIYFEELFTVEEAEWILQTALGD
jgi:hypothetical protein